MNTNKIIKIPQELEKLLSPTGSTPIKVLLKEAGKLLSSSHECVILSTSAESSLDKAERRIAKLTKDLYVATGEKNEANERAKSYELFHEQLELNRAKVNCNARKAKLIDQLNDKLAGRMSIEQAVDIVHNELIKQQMKVAKASIQHQKESTVGYSYE
ncbi:hypothetical protein LP316_02720 [Thalassotalea sp. LPB0316]|uniref:hypothetical protein n=1 Tax=Thalassotalea sp. LPB0316 TaxID=2769490 RepID=UPI0018679BEA|nr:hypothetical protein [Thalassotalea sp. LPB0316]QOL26233.1 hypothetical protein LP316_02720 [Thalassotalea sp. LPB0316]